MRSTAGALHPSVRCCSVKQSCSSSSTTTSNIAMNPGLSLAAPPTIQLSTSIANTKPSYNPNTTNVEEVEEEEEEKEKEKVKEDKKKKMKMMSILHSHPLYSQTHPNLSFQFKEKILCLEILGVDAGKALSLNPSLLSASLDSVHAVISFLQSKGIHQDDLPRIFGMCPTILTSNTQTELAPVFEFLSFELGINDPQRVRKVINKCPRLLACSVRDQLKPALFFLQRLGFRDMTALAFNDPVLLVSSVEKTLLPKLDFLMGLMGLSRKEVTAMVLRCPVLFTFSIENNFKPKFDYFAREMKGRVEDLLDFPQFFGFSLEKRIKPRHLEALETGAELDLPTLLKTTDEQFRQLLLLHQRRFNSTHQHRRVQIDRTQTQTQTHT